MAPRVVDGRSRREFLSTAGLLGLAGLRSGPLLAQQQGLADKPWTPRAVAKLTALQEQAYAQLGKQLGLGSDSMTTYRYLTRDRIPRERISTSAFDKTFGPMFGATQDLGAQHKVIQQYLQQYRDAPVPTPYEEPSWYSVLFEMSDAIRKTAASASLDIPGNILFGSLPTGRINAQTISMGKAREHIVLLDHGLFILVSNIASIVGRAFPPLVPDSAGGARFAAAPNPVQALAKQPEIQDQFNRMLYAYVVWGNPRWTPTFSLETSRIPAAAMLLRSTQLFVLSHEYSHVIGRHLESNEAGSQATEGERVRWAWDAEYYADHMGLNLLVGVMSPPALPYSFWGTECFFGCIDIIDRCVSVLAKGSATGAKPSDTHPATTDRRPRLRQVLNEFASKEDAQGAIQVAEQLRLFLETLWKQSQPRWLELHKNGERPSPIWPTA